MQILIIETGIAPDKVNDCCASQAQWFIQALAPLVEPHKHITVDVVRPYLDEKLPDPWVEKKVAILTGSWGMVTDHEDWSERTAEWVRNAMAAQWPLFGVCYGHQLMAYALGGEVSTNPRGPELGTFPITLNEAARNDPLLKPYPPIFDCYLFHEQSVVKPPSHVTILAHSSKDPCQILRYTHHAYSVQFHPEFTQPVISAALEDSYNHAPEKIHSTPVAAQTPWARQILLDFVKQAGSLS